MPDFHQPDEDDRRRAELAGDAEGVTGDWAERVPLDQLRERAVAAGVDGVADLDHEQLVEAIRRRPSSASDPNSPDRPRT